MTTQAIASPYQPQLKFCIQTDRFASFPEGTKDLSLFLIAWNRHQFPYLTPNNLFSKCYVKDSSVLDKNNFTHGNPLFLRS